jgi:hypothetical protein
MYEIASSYIAPEKFVISMPDIIDIIKVKVQMIFNFQNKTIMAGTNEPSQKNFIKYLIKTNDFHAYYKPSLSK